MVEFLPYVMLFAFAAYLIIEAAEAAHRRWKARRPKRWKLQLTAPDGQPGQAYSLTQTQLNRVIALVRFELEHSDEAK